MIEINGIEEAIQTIDNLHAQLEELSEIEEVILHRLKVIAVDNTPVDTGAMKSAWVVEKSELKISNSSYNPKTGAPVSKYAPLVAERTGIMEKIDLMIPKVVDMAAERFGFTVGG